MKLTDEEVRAFLVQQSRKLIPKIDVNETFNSFYGCRAKSDRSDFVIEISKQNGRFLNVAGIESPGLASSPAIAFDVVHRLIPAMWNKSLQRKSDFHSRRRPFVVPKDGFEGLKFSEMKKRFIHKPENNIVCKCEKVTEQEVINTLRDGKLPIDSTQAVRKRTRAGMGRCQADPKNYNCEVRIAEIIARERKIPLEHVGRRPWPGTSILPRRWLKKSDLKQLSKL
jgi:glycerol-3-phosphate dehydrogenase